MTDLERYRDEIDEIDSEIVRLFEKRMKVIEEVAEYKIKTGKQVLDPARESQKIHTTVPAVDRAWDLRRAQFHNCEACSP